MRILSITLALASLVALAKPQASNDPLALVALPQFLLIRPDIKEELKVTPVQAQQIDVIVAESAGAAPREVHGQTELRQAFVQAQSTGDKIVSVLDPAQKKRLRELRIQTRGASALLMPDVKKELALSDKQIRAIRAERAKAMDAYTAAGREQKYQALAPKIDNAYQRAALKVLTAKQAKKFKTMQGKPFRDIRMPGTASLYPPVSMDELRYVRPVGLAHRQFHSRYESAPRSHGGGATSRV